jgi:multidrug efflux pump
MVTIKVTTTLEGISSEATETNITVPLENLLATMPSLHGMHSTSAHGVSTIWLQFTNATAQEALQQVQSRTARVASALPANVHGPVVTESSYPH